jgi:hypothetical protein
MSFTSRSRLTALAIPAVLVIAACGSSSTTGSTATPTMATARPSAAATPLAAALNVGDIANSGFFSQKSDSNLGGLTSTSARVFANADSTLIVEVDLVSDTGATGAASDYPPYQSAAAKQVGTASSASKPGLGQQSNEYVGTNAAGKKVVSISFIEGRYIAVVTTVANSTVTSDVIKTSAESIAQAQDSKITSIGS